MKLNLTNKGTVSRARQGRCFKAGPISLGDNERIVDTVVMGNEKLWNAFQEREALCQLTELIQATNASPR